MASMQQIKDLAHKWFSLYRADDTAKVMTAESFADECFTLNFEMDTVRASSLSFPRMLSCMQMHRKLSVTERIKGTFSASYR